MGRKAGRRRDAARERPVVRRVDHVMVRTEDPAALFELLTGKLGLPAGQPPATHPGGFTNAAVGLGNAYLECILFGPAPEEPVPGARLWGLAFEPAGPLDGCREGLKARGIPHAAPQVFERPGQDGEWQVMWTTLLFGMLKRTRRARVTFFVQRAFGGLQRRQVRRLTEKAYRGEPVRQMDEGRIDSMNDAIGHGWTFLCEYDPGFVDPVALREEMREALREKGGGTLGVERLREVVVGSPDSGAARERWAGLLAPTPPEEPGLWRPGGGPAVRVAEHPEDRLVALVFEVSSLEGARSFLEAEGMLGEAPEGEVAVERASIGGLDVRLVEGSGHGPIDRRSAGDEGP